MQLKLCFVFAALAMTSATALCADIEAGKTKVAQTCAECHRPSDWNGETQAALESLIRDVASGKVPHSKRTVRLSDREIADIAAYWASTHK